MLDREEVAAIVDEIRQRSVVEQEAILRGLRRQEGVVSADEWADILAVLWTWCRVCRRLVAEG